MPSAWRRAPRRAWAPSLRWCGSARCSLVGVSRTRPHFWGDPWPPQLSSVYTGPGGACCRGWGRLGPVPSSPLDLGHIHWHCPHLPHRGPGVLQALISLPSWGPVLWLALSWGGTADCTPLPFLSLIWDQFEGYMRLSQLSPQRENRVQRPSQMALFPPNTGSP